MPLCDTHNLYPANHASGDWSEDIAIPAEQGYLANPTPDPRIAMSAVVGR